MGETVLEHKLATTPEAMKQVFRSMPRCRIAMETGTHSPWVSRLLISLGHEVIVGHAQKVRLITKSRRKDDRLGPQTLARLARIDPELLRANLAQPLTAGLHQSSCGIHQGGSRAHQYRSCPDLRQVRLRTAMLHRAQTTSALSTGLREGLEPLLREVESLNERIQEYDRRIERWPNRPTRRRRCSNR